MRVITFVIVSNERASSYKYKWSQQVAASLICVNSAGGTMLTQKISSHAHQVLLIIDILIWRMLLGKMYF